MTTKDFDWNMIELTEIYESFDMVLRLLDEDFERARRVIEAAIKHGATPESLVEPIEAFAMELPDYCDYLERLKDKKENKNQNS